MLSQKYVFCQMGKDCPDHDSGGMHRPIISLMEELAALDGTQRMDACRDPSFSKELKEYLFTEMPVLHPEREQG